MEIDYNLQSLPTEILTEIASYLVKRKELKNFINFSYLVSKILTSQLDEEFLWRNAVKAYGFKVEYLGREHPRQALSALFFKIKTRLNIQSIPFSPNGCIDWGSATYLQFNLFNTVNPKNESAFETHALDTLGAKAQFPDEWLLKVLECIEDPDKVAICAEIASREKESFVYKLYRPLDEALARVIAKGNLKLARVLLEGPLQIRPNIRHFDLAMQQKNRAEWVKVLSKEEHFSKKRKRSEAFEEVNLSSNKRRAIEQEQGEIQDAALQEDGRNLARLYSAILKGDLDCIQSLVDQDIQVNISCLLLAYYSDSPKAKEIQDFLLNRMDPKTQGLAWLKDYKDLILSAHEQNQSLVQAIWERFSPYLLGLEDEDREDYVFIPFAECSDPIFDVLLMCPNFMNSKTVIQALEEPVGCLISSLLFIIFDRVAFLHCKEYAGIMTNVDLRLWNRVESLLDRMLKVCEEEDYSRDELLVWAAQVCMELNGGYLPILWRLYKEIEDSESKEELLDEIRNSDAQNEDFLFSLWVMELKILKDLQSPDLEDPLEQWLLESKNDNELLSKLVCSSDTTFGLFMQLRTGFSNRNVERYEEADNILNTLVHVLAKEYLKDNASNRIEDRLRLVFFKIGEIDPREELLNQIIQTVQDLEIEKTEEIEERKTKLIEKLKEWESEFFSPLALSARIEQSQMQILRKFLESQNL